MKIQDAVGQGAVASPKAFPLEDVILQDVILFPFTFSKTVTIWNTWLYNITELMNV